MTERPLRILLLGDGDAAEMRPVTAALEALRSNCAVTVVQRIARVVTAAAHLVEEDGWFPDLVVVCQRWPREFSRKDVGRLFQILPLARWVCCFGAWCESDGRNFDIWPHAVRVPARYAEDRLHREIAVLAGRLAALPATAGRDETFEFDFGGDSIGGFRVPERAPPVLLAVADQALHHWLKDSLRAAGYSIVAESFDGQLCTDARPVVILFDADPWNNRTAVRLRSIGARHPSAAIIMLLAFAHPEDLAAFSALGAAATVAKLGSPNAIIHALSAHV